MPEDAGVSRQVGPLPVWGWVAVGAGTFLVYFLYRRYRAAASGTSSYALVGGTTIPQPGTEPLTENNTLGGWKQNFIKYLTTDIGMSGSDALNGLENWLSGACVTDKQYKGLSSGIPSVGYPPGMNAVPPLQICANSTEETASSPPDQLLGLLATINDLGYEGQGYFIRDRATPGGRTGGSFWDGSGNAIYSTVSTFEESVRLLQNGQTIYYMTAPGVFRPINSVAEFTALENARQGPQTTTWQKSWERKVTTKTTPTELAA